MKKYKLTLAYDGSQYSGWQIQPNAISIQEVLRDVLKKILQDDTYPVASGRTDAGVHARGQVAHITTDKEFDLGRFHHSLNGLLPKDIRVLSIEEVPNDFHARYSACGKTYHYHLHLDKVHDPFLRNYRWQVPYKIDPKLLQEAVQQFIGTHDFSSFANEASKGAAAKNAVRTIHDISVIPQDGGIRLEFHGNGFLYKMVRNIVGMLVEVAGGKKNISDIAKILAMKDRRLAGRAAPAHGLFLMKVDYPISSNEE